MALIECPECGNKVSNSAMMCPYCGFGVKEYFLNFNKNKNSFYSDDESKNFKGYIDSEKRKYRRIKQRIKIKVNQKQGILMDISRYGIKLATTVVPTEPDIDIQITVDDRSFNLKGHIRWEGKERTFSNLKELGISIDKAPEQYYRFLEHLLEKEAKKIKEEGEEENKSLAELFS